MSQSNVPNRESKGSGGGSLSQGRRFLVILAAVFATVVSCGPPSEIDLALDRLEDEFTVAEYRNIIALLERDGVNSWQDNRLQSIRRANDDDITADENLEKLRVEAASDTRDDTRVAELIGKTVLSPINYVSSEASEIAVSVIGEWEDRIAAFETELETMAFDLNRAEVDDALSLIERNAFHARAAADFATLSQAIAAAANGTVERAAKALDDRAVAFVNSFNSLVDAYVSDAVQVFVSSIQGDLASRRFHVASERILSISELVHVTTETTWSYGHIIVEYEETVRIASQTLTETPLEILETFSSLTSIQKSEYLQNLTGKYVNWTGEVGDVSDISDYSGQEIRSASAERDVVSYEGRSYLIQFSYWSSNNYSLPDMKVNVLSNQIDPELRVNDEIRYRGRIGFGYEPFSFYDLVLFVFAIDENDPHL